MTGFTRIGFLADTHSNRSDGSDLPDSVLAAFDGVDLIVHLGDVGRKGILDRLEAVAPVWVKVADKGFAPRTDEDHPVRVIAAGDGGIGLTFGIGKVHASLKTGDDGLIAFGGDDLTKVFHRRFGLPVTAVAFGGTHIGTCQDHGGVTWFNPGSPNMPTPPHPGTVAVADLASGRPVVELVEIR